MEHKRENLHGRNIFIPCSEMLTSVVVLLNLIEYTGEMSHHEVLDAVHKGIHVILTRHSNSERGFLKVAANHHLKNLMPEVQ